MAGIDRAPPRGSWAADRMRAYRQARLLIARTEHLGEENIERELHELDDATVGTDAAELERLRSRARARDSGA